MAVPATTQTSDPPHRAGVAALRDRLVRLVQEVGKFGVVGGATFLVDTALFNLLRSPVGPIWAKVCSTAVAATLAFIGNRYWTWRHRPRAALHREYLLYFIFNVVGLGIGLGCLGVSHWVLGQIWSAFQSRAADNLSGQIIGTALGTLFRFWAYRRFVFPVESPQPARAGAAADSG